MTIVNIQRDFEEVIGDILTSVVEDDKFWINIIEEDQLEDGEAHEEVVKVSKDKDLVFTNENGLLFKKISDKTYTITFKGVTTRLRAPISTIDTDFEDVTSFEVSPQKELALLGSDNGDLRLISLKDNKDQLLISDAHFGTVTHSKFFPTGQVGLSVGQDLQIKIWDLLNGNCPRTFVGHKDRITDIALIDRGRNFLTSSKDGSIRLWDCASGKEITSLHRENSLKDPVNAILVTEGAAEASPKNNGLEFGTSGKFLFAGHESGVISQFDLGTKKQVNIFKSLFSKVKSICQFSSYEFIAGYEDGTVCIWNFENLSEPVFKVQSLPKIAKVKFQEEPRRVLVSNEYGLLELIDLASQSSHEASERTFVAGIELGNEIHISPPGKEFHFITNGGVLGTLN